MAENNTSTNVEKKPAKAAEKKPNWFVKTFKGIKKWCHELRIELKKVVWPSRQQVTHDTGTVLAVVTVIGAVIWVFDLLSTSVVRALINLFAA